MIAVTSRSPNNPLPTRLASLLALLVGLSLACTLVQPAAPQDSGPAATPTAADADDGAERTAPTLKPTVAAEPTDAAALYDRGVQHYMMGEYEDALEDLAAAIDLDYRPAASAYSALADAFYGLGDRVGVMWAYGQAYDQDADFVSAYTTRFTRYDAAIREQPDVASLYFARGWALYMLGNAGRAAADLSTAIELGFEPLSRAYHARGDAQYAVGEHAEAVADYSRAIELDGGAFGSHFDRGNAYAALGAFEQAVADFQTAIDSHPDMAMAHNNLCWFASLLGHAADVMGSCERAVELEPDSASYRDSRGLARALVGDFEGAIEDFEYFIEVTQSLGYYEAMGQERQAWVAELKTGRNPFDEATLQRLLQE